MYDHSIIYSHKQNMNELKVQIFVLNLSMSKTEWLLSISNEIQLNDDIKVSSLSLKIMQ